MLKKVYYVAKAPDIIRDSEYLIHHAIARFEDETEARTYRREYRKAHANYYVFLIETLESVKGENNERLQG